MYDPHGYGGAPGYAGPPPNFAGPGYGFNAPGYGYDGPGPGYGGPGPQYNNNYGQPPRPPFVNGPPQQQYYGHAQDGGGYDGGGYDDYNQGGEEYEEEEYGDGFCMDDMGVSRRLKSAIGTAICSSTDATSRRRAHWPIVLVMD